jgi:tetratricopeptide (TPR) repeat protein
VRAALLSLPPRLSAWALEAADDQTRRYAFRGTVEQSLASVRRVRWLLAADPERPVTSVLPSGIRRGRDERREDALLARWRDPREKRERATLYEAIERIARASSEPDLAKRRDAFQAAIDVDRSSADVAYYVSWGGIIRGLPIEDVLPWVDRAAALSAHESERDRYHVLHLVGYALHRAGEPERAALFLRRSHEASRRLKSALPAYHLATVLMALDRVREAKRVLVKALEKDDTFWDTARGASAFAPLRESGELEELIEEAARTFD